MNVPDFPVEGPKRAAAPFGAAAALFAMSGLTAWGAARKATARVKAARPSAGAAVSAHAVGKAFGARRILDGVSFDLEPGAALVLWGANGAGKSTFIKCLLGLYAHEGSISLFGKDASSDGAAARERVGYVPQHSAGYDWRDRKSTRLNSSHG